MSKSFNDEIYTALVCICETCVDESKLHISSQKAVEEIRHYLDFMNDDRFDKKFDFGFRKEIKEKDQRIAELEKEVEELKEENKFLEENNRIIRGLCHNYYEQLNNYKTEKYDLGIRVEELRKIKFNSFIDKKRYYKGFENCERQCASHIVDLQDKIKVLEKALELACKEFKTFGFIEEMQIPDYFKQKAEKELGDKE